MWQRILIGWTLLFASGCMHVPLRNNTANEAQTVADLYQQQVLNNLAMFAYDPNSLPYFSFANQGSSTVNDSGSIGATPTWSRATTPGLPFLFSSLGTSVSAQQQAGIGFTLTPVNDPRRLELMRCAYQRSIAACNGTAQAANCPDCQTRFKSFYTGSPDGDIGSSAKGAVTSECLGSGCWLGIGCKKAVPKECPCQLVGEYCGVYVWVLRGRRDELSKLTLAILDYAINSPPTEAQKTVYYMIDERGLPATSDAAVGYVTATVGVSERNESLLNIPRPDEVSLRDKLQNDLAAINAQIDAAQRANRVATLEQLFKQRQILQGKLNFLDQQLQVGGLKQQYIGGPAVGSPGSPAGPGGNGLFNLNLIQTLNPPASGAR